MPREIASDCRYFLGDRPCIWHKRQGLLCTCECYDPIRENILLIKLDAMGDVLRTTALLPLLAKTHPQAALTWITRPESKPLLENNPYVTEVVSYGADSLIHLLARSFNRVINLDAGKVSAGLATAARSLRKDGFLLNEKGYVVATNEAARRWLEMGIFDDLKRANRRTYQSIMAEILGLPSTGHHYVLELKASEQEEARSHLRSLGLNPSRPIVGLNTGAGGRWQLKQWRLDGFQELIERLHEESEVQILLLGGKAERDRHEWLKKHANAPVFDAGNDNELRHFAALTAQCAVVVTGDTLAMHVALATERRVVVLFGPTSAAEIELYDLGEKVVPNMECLVCYKQTCDYVSNCMDQISVDMVVQAVKRQLRLASARSLSLAVL
ncbi:MAG TPA: glycosyltransferase family 9 protein [Gemmataceae bacterium]|jgi:heptosyltransferase-2